MLLLQSLAAFFLSMLSILILRYLVHWYTGILLHILLQSSICQAWLQPMSVSISLFASPQWHSCEGFYYKWNKVSELDTESLNTIYLAMTTCFQEVVMLSKEMTTDVEVPAMKEKVLCFKTKTAADNIASCWNWEAFADVRAEKESRALITSKKAKVTTSPTCDRKATSSVLDLYVLLSCFLLWDHISSIAWLHDWNEIQRSFVSLSNTGIHNLQCWRW